MPNKLSKSRFAIVIAGVIFFVVGVVGIVISVLSNQKFSLDSDQYGSSEFVDLSKSDYDALVSSQKSALIFVDQDGCITADGVEDLARDLMQEKNIQVYRILFSDARETSLHDDVKYYPSFVIMKKGKVVSWLKADSNEDTERFKDKTAFNSWLDSYINW